MRGALFLIFTFWLACSANAGCNYRLYAGVLPMVFIEQSGDVCEIASLPAPFNTMIPVRQGPGVFAYTWPYQHRPLQVGFLYVTVDEAGKGEATVEVSNGERYDGDTFLVSITFLDANQKEVHIISARLGVDGKVNIPSVFPGLFGNKSDQKTFHFDTIVRPPEWWRSIAFIKFGYMKVNTHPQ